MDESINWKVCFHHDIFRNQRYVFNSWRSWKEKNRTSFLLWKIIFSQVRDESKSIPSHSSTNAKLFNTGRSHSIQYRIHPWWIGNQLLINIQKLVRKKNDWFHKKSSKNLQFLLWSDSTKQANALCWVWTHSRRQIQLFCVCIPTTTKSFTQRQCYPNAKKYGTSSSIEKAMRHCQASMTIFLFLEYCNKSVKKASHRSFPQFTRYPKHLRSKVSTCSSL